MSILAITGANGYIGQKLLSQLSSSGAEVHALVRVKKVALTKKFPNVSFHILPSDTKDLYELLKSIRPSSLYHLAAKYLSDHSISDFPDLLAANLILPSQLFEAAYRLDIPHIIVASSVAEHWGNQKYRPTCLYAAHRRAMFDIAQYYTNIGHTKFAFLKIYETFGEDDHRDKLLLRLIDTAIQSKKLSLSHPKQLLEMVHVDDVVSAFIKAEQYLGSDLSKPGVLNSFSLRSPDPISLEELVSFIQKALKHPVNTKWESLESLTKGSNLTPLWTGDSLVPGWIPDKSSKQHLASCIRTLTSLKISLNR